MSVDVANYRGELAALVTAFCWTASALAFTAAAKRLGSLVLNLVRLAIALGFMTLYGWLVRGLPLPTDATAHNWLWLSLSGLVGFTFGDLCLFRAFVLIGPRVTMLLMALVPMIAAIVSWAALGEALPWTAGVGMALTIGGVAWVVLEQRPPHPELPHTVSAAGILLALGAATGQAVGLVLSKVGMAGYDPFASTHIRTIAGLGGFAAIFLVTGAWPRLAAGLKSGAGVGYASVGALFGPFIGVSLSLVAITYTWVGVAATIMSIVPVLIIPFMIVIYHERVSLRAVLGALAAVGGVAVLFLWR